MAEAGHAVTDEAHHVQEPRHSHTAFGIVFCIAQHGRFHYETDCGLYMGGICINYHLTFLFNSIINKALQSHALLDSVPSQVFICLVIFLNR